jgi:hypothetical protein
VEGESLRLDVEGLLVEGEGLRLGMAGLVVEGRGRRDWAGIPGVAGVRLSFLSLQEEHALLHLEKNIELKNLPTQTQ